MTFFDAADQVHCYSVNSPADIEVTNWRPLSDSELISRTEMRLLARVTRGPSEEPYHTVSTVYFILGILRTDLWRKGRPFLDRNEELYIHLHMN